MNCFLKGSWSTLKGKNLHFCRRVLSTRQAKGSYKLSPFCKNGRKTWRRTCCAYTLKKLTEHALITITSAYAVGRCVHDGWSINPLALRKAKIVCNFGLSECKRVKLYGYTFMFFLPLLQRGITFVTLCLLPWTLKPLQNGVSCQRSEFF